MSGQGDKPRRSSPADREARQARAAAARLYAVQALFQMETSGQTVERVVREFESHRFGEVFEDGTEMAEGDVVHFRALVDSAVNW